MLIDTSEFIPKGDYVLLVNYSFQSPDENSLQLLFLSFSRKGTSYENLFVFSKRKDQFNQFSFPCLSSSKDECVLYSFQRQQFQASQQNILKVCFRDYVLEFGFKPN